jgi:hypothetical protein
MVGWGWVLAATAGLNMDRERPARVVRDAFGRGQAAAARTCYQGRLPLRPQWPAQLPTCLPAPRRRGDTPVSATPLPVHRCRIEEQDRWVRGKCASDAVQSGKDARFWQVGTAQALAFCPLLPCAALGPATPGQQLAGAAAGRRAALDVGGSSNRLPLAAPAPPC